MLTGEHSISDGLAFVNKVNIKNDFLAANRQFGYCPQFDALLEQLTAKETLQMYSKLKGIPPNKIDQSIENILKLLGIQKFENQRVN